MKEMLSVRRLWLLVRNDAVQNFRTILTVLAAYAAILLILNLQMPDVSQLRDNYYLAWFAGVLVVWGTIATSRSFRDLHDKTRNEAYLLIPASTLEKTLARLLTHTIGFVFFLLAFTLLLSLMVEALNGLLARRHNALFNVFDPLVWKAVSQYLVIQSYYFLGAAWFRRTHFIKTSLAISVAFIMFFLVAFTSMRLLLGSYWWNNIGTAADSLTLMHGPVADGVLALAQLVNFVVIPVVCWYTAYLRVAETQVSDGV